MTDTTIPSAKKRPDFVAYAVIPGSQGTATRFIRLGVGFALKNGGISILSDAAPLSGHVILTAIDDELPALDGLKHGTPLHAPHLTASMVRDSADGKGYWTDIGTAYRHEGYVSVHVAVWPAAGKVILTQPKERQ